MEYSDDFKTRCLKAFPDWGMMEEHLEKGSAFVGRLLADSCPSVDAIELSKLILTDIEKAKEIAEKSLVRQKLYAEWWNNYRK